MKKILAIIILVACMLTTACGTSNDSSNDSSNPTTAVNSNTEPTTSIEIPSTSDTDSSEPGQVEINFDPLALVAAYCDGTWDGSFIFDEEHCASIENGSLWLDCRKQEEIPDMGIYEKPSYWTQVISSDEEGTWVKDKDLGTLSLWRKGTRLKEIRANATYYTSVYKLASSLVVRNGDHIQSWTLEGYHSDSMSNVVDCYLNEQGEVLCSNYEHENFTIKEDGTFEEISSTYVRFPRSQSTLIYDEENSGLRKDVSHRYIYTDWDGDLQAINEGVFVAVDYDGNIIANNKVIGNVHLPIDIMGLEGSNLYYYNKCYYLDGENLRIFSEGQCNQVIDVPAGDGEFLWVDSNLNLVVAQTYNGETNTLFIVRDNAYQIVSESCVDCNVAYDTLYYMEGNTVYALDWADPEATPSVFFEGAYAVTPFSDEGEGALVHWEQANFKCYGYNNIYSPYGIPWDEEE